MPLAFLGTAFIWPSLVAKNCQNEWFVFLFEADWLFVFDYLCRFACTIRGAVFFTKRIPAIYLKEIFAFWIDFKNKPIELITYE